MLYLLHRWNSVLKQFSQICLICVLQHCSKYPATTLCMFIVGGRGGRVTLGHVLRFITGRQMKSYYQASRCILQQSFVRTHSFFPTSNTCENRLKLVHGSLTTPLPSEAELFQIFDVAFGCAYFGNCSASKLLQIFLPCSCFT